MNFSQKSKIVSRVKRIELIISGQAFYKYVGKSPHKTSLTLSVLSAYTDKQVSKLALIYTEGRERCREFVENID